VARVKRAKQLEFLEAVPMFRGLSKADLMKVARVTEQVTVPADTVLAEQDAPGDAFYLIISGVAVVRRNGRKINDMAAGDFFGEMALVDGGPRSATVMTLEESTLFMIHRKDFSSLVGVPSIARRLLEGLSQRLRDADSRLIS
jgi:CRP-like cAMP-binding protein